MIIRLFKTKHRAHPNRKHHLFVFNTIFGILVVDVETGWSFGKIHPAKITRLFDRRNNFEIKCWIGYFSMCLILGLTIRYAILHTIVGIIILRLLYLRHYIVNKNSESDDESGS